MGMAGGSGLARAGDCGGGLERREKRSAEQTHLLAGQNGSRTARESC